LLLPEAWERIAEETVLVLNEAVNRMGTTFSAYRTLWNEPGLYGDQLRVYDRAGMACGRCGTAIKSTSCGSCGRRTSAMRSSISP
jgi:formamidopyrimidine-DNA glycosylase